jgi:hypothetical protein
MNPVSSSKKEHFYQRITHLLQARFDLLLFEYGSWSALLNEFIMVPMTELEPEQVIAAATDAKADLEKSLSTSVLMVELIDCCLNLELRPELLLYVFVEPAFAAQNTWDVELLHVLLHPEGLEITAVNCVNAAYVRVHPDENDPWWDGASARLTHYATLGSRFSETHSR